MTVHKRVLYNKTHNKVHIYELGIRGENMETVKRMFMTAEEVAEVLGVSKGHAYKLIRALNEELQAQGYLVVAGKVPTKYFQEKFYGATSA